MAVVRSHAADFVQKRLAPAAIPNDGKQTPYKGHPVFKAQHATATCCRGCLLKWYRIPKNRSLTSKEVEAIVGVIVAWIGFQSGSPQDSKIKS
jgi:exodeoxyribonuclease V alpha subunit